MNQLTVKQKQYLKGLAHPLEPVVMIGDKGLTDGVLKEINVNLLAHELIKIRVFGDDRKLRTHMIHQICEASGAELVQHIGKLLVMYKAHPKKPKIKLEG